MSYISPDLFKQVIPVTTLALPLISGVVVLLNNFVKEGIFFTRKKLKHSEQIEFIKDISYLDEKAKNNCKNSIIFRAITGKQAPVHIVNLIFNCYDPVSAMYIYSKAINYIKFNKKGQLSKPENIQGKALISSLYIMLIAAFLLTSSSLYAILVLMYVLFTLNNFRDFLIVLRLLSIVLLCFGSSLWAINYSLSEFSFLGKVDRFYKGHDHWKVDQGIDDLEEL
jgi:hypothetical protein